MHGWWMMGSTWVFWIIVVGVILWIAGVGSPSRGVDARRTPEDILRDRYARGEISPEEFQRGMKTLRDRMTEEQARTEPVVISREEELDTDREGATETKDKGKKAA